MTSFDIAGKAVASAVLVSGCSADKLTVAFTDGSELAVESADGYGHESWLEVRVTAADPAAPPPAEGRHRSSDGATARQAAKDVAPRVGTQRHKVLYGLWNVGASTAEELVAVTGVEYRSITPRIGELKRHLLVRETGDTRLGTHGSAQAIIEITEAGERALGYEPRPAPNVLFGP